MDFRILSRVKAASLLLPLFIAQLQASDWPNWRGPQHNGHSAEAGWLAAWPKDGAPKELWRAKFGQGHSAISVRGDTAYTVGWDGEKDTVVCLDATTGKVRWQQSYPSETIVQWPGPRATPTIDGDTVYTLGQHGQLRAWNAQTGAPKWKRDLPKAYEPDVDYGFAWSPLIAEDLLILAAGSHGIGLRKSDGEMVWGDDGKRGACASPVPFEHNGKRAVALITTDAERDNVNLYGVDPQTGHELWRGGPWAEKWGAACVDLLVADGHVFVTTAEQFKKCARFSIRDRKLVEDWSNRKLASYTGNVVLVDGYLYGVDKTGILHCLAWETGEEKWAQRGFGEFGSLIAADGKLIVQASKGGDVAIVEATPTAYHELRRLRVFTDERDTFTAPILANGRLYCRSYAGEVVCFELGSRER